MPDEERHEAPEKNEPPETDWPLGLRPDAFGAGMDGWVMLAIAAVVGIGIIVVERLSS